MQKFQIAPYGSWKSPISSDMIVSKAVRLGQVELDGADIYWVEMRPEEAGRNVIVRRTPSGQTTDITPARFNVRSRAHEYGGGALAVYNAVVYFSNFEDQRIYRQTDGATPHPVTPKGAYRYADGIMDFQRDRMICIREDHSNSNQEAVNTIVSLKLDGKDSGQILVSGNDFYSSPRISPDGLNLAWLSWNHPNMPWDGTELWIGEIQNNGSLSRLKKIAGGEEESIFQPQWSPDGVLYFISDKSGWWNPYRWRDGSVESLISKTAEFGLPQWIFGMSIYAFESSDRMICAFHENGAWQLASINLYSGKFQSINIPYSNIEEVRGSSGQVVFKAGSADRPTSIVRLDLTTHQFEVLRQSTELSIEPGFLSGPETIEFPTESGLTAYGYFYPPQNRNFRAKEGELPPLIVKSHGGPTAATSTTLELKIQFWTSRGFAILDVNYGGSTGYGRVYRQRLDSKWGIVDVDDCVNGAKYLVERGLVDGNRLAIVGGSAGGYTTLAALTFRNFFKAGASYYGISDLEGLVKDTHKFESRYLDRLIGPYPAKRELYRERSPIHFTDQLSCPIIIFQGSEDVVVPPNQAEMMVTALRKNGLPVAYVLFEEEQHGFRKAENIKRAIESELYFYSNIFKFKLIEMIGGLQIDNL